MAAAHLGELLGHVEAAVAVEVVGNGRRDEVMLALERLWVARQLAKVALEGLRHPRTPLPATRRARATSAQEREQ